MGFLLQDMDSMVRTTMAMEREIDDSWSIRDASANEKKRENRSSFSLGKQKDFRDRAEVIRVKAKLGHLAKRGRWQLSLPPAWTHETRLPTDARIPRLWDTSVSIISGTCTYKVCLSLLQHGLGELVSVPGCGIGTGYFSNRLERPGHGSRSGIGLTGRDFGDPRVCVCHYTSD